MKPGNGLMKKIALERKSRVLLPSIFLAMMIAACSPSPATTPATTPTAGGSPSTPTAGGSASGDARSALLRAMEAQLTAGPYRVVASIVSGPSTNAMHGEVILPDHFHLFSSINGGPEREYIIIGSTTYAKLGSTWMVLQIDLSSMLSGLVNRVDPATISDVQLAGPENVNGTATLAYTFTYTNTVAGTLITDHDKMWVGVGNGLPVKQVVDGVVSGAAFHNEQTIEYDSSITIVAPATR